MKNIHALILVMVCLFCVTFSSVAQNEADQHRTFMSILASGDNGAAYNELILDYKLNVEVLKSASKDSERYKKSRETLLQIWPHLENAAIYYSGQHNNANAILMARAYIEIPLMDDFRGVEFNYSPNRAKLAYFVASKLFNARDFEASIPFLREYIKTNDEQYRKNVFLCLIKACSDTGNKRMARSALDEAVNYYPNDYNIVSMGINMCLESEDYESLQTFLDKAKSIRPGDPSLANIQARLYEETRQYENAANAYLGLYQSNPNSLELNKHVALNIYNMGALSCNKAVTETDAEVRTSLITEAKGIFAKAIPFLENVVAAEPHSHKYNTALALAYAQTGRKDMLDVQNRALAGLGLGTVNSEALPPLMSYSTGSMSIEQQTPSTPSNDNAIREQGRPKYSDFARTRIEGEVERWMQKDPYETAEEYRERVTEAERDKLVAKLQEEAEKAYIDLYASDIRITDLDLKPYDAENGVFLIESNMGQMVLPVPRDNNEARLFEKNWKGISLSNPRFFIADDDLAIAEVTFVTPTGLNYKYNNNDALSYTQTRVDVRFNDIDYSHLAQNKPSARQANINTVDVSVGTSDVDTDIPLSNTVNSNTFALVISNENYQMAENVPMANNDGAIFAEYCKKTLGIPENNVMYYKDASFGVMMAAMRRLQEIADAYRNDSFNVIFYYAGHGIPNEATKDGFLLPVDASGKQTEVCYSLKKLYGELGGLGANSVVAFLDACFSGAGREGGMLASARGIALKVKEEDPRGNMVVFSAATGDETAYPYKEKSHGLFTYYLLKKLQETSGDASLHELGEYIIDNVRKQSVIVNHKSQTPTVAPAPAVTGVWREWKLK